MVDSLFVAIPLVLQSIICAITPLAEERWLEEQYGEVYTRYKKGFPDFFGAE